MKRRTWLGGCLGSSLVVSAYGQLRTERLAGAEQALSQATASGQVSAAVIHVEQRGTVWSRAFGSAGNDQAMFLLGSISKPICMTALLTLLDRGQLQLDDRLQKYLPDFRGEGREEVTLRHVLTHVSGLPDQLPENDSLRKKHAPLSEFVSHAQRTPLQFAPGSRYQYSSMGILLAARVAELLSGTEIRKFVDQAVFQPLGLRRSAQGLGSFALADMVRAQTERAAPESGGGDPNTRDWDWNSPYWRQLGAPWGGTHCSAGDVAKILQEFLVAAGRVVRPETAKLMIQNHNPPGFTPRGLGWGLGPSVSSRGCSPQTFGHTGSTGTIAWADPASQTIVVILTSLPARAVQPHPRDTAAAAVVAALS